MNETLKVKENKDISNTNATQISPCDNVLIYTQRVVVPAALQRNFK